MSKLIVVKGFKFDSAHLLPSHPGKCKQLHGHTFKLEGGVEGSINPSTGMIVDFGDLKSIVNNFVIDQFDHKYLNDFFEVPTAETIVAFIVATLTQNLPDGVSLYSVRLYETEDSYCEWLAN